MSALWRASSAAMRNDWTRLARLWRVGGRADAKKYPRKSFDNDLRRHRNHNDRQERQGGRDRQCAKIDEADGNDAHRIDIGGDSIEIGCRREVVGIERSVAGRMLQP